VLTALSSLEPQPLAALAGGGNDTPAAETRAAIPTPANIFLSLSSPIYNLLGQGRFPSWRKPMKNIKAIDLC